MNCFEVEKGEMIESYLRRDLSESELERLEEHLLACERCHQQLEDLSLLRAALEADESREVVEKRGTSIPWHWIGLAAAAVLILVLIFWPRLVEPPGSGGVAIARLAEVQPPPYEPKSLRTSGSEAELRFREAMVSYQEDRFAEAISGLESAVALDPDFAPARFYLGASYLLTGKAREAVDNLSRIVEVEGSPYREWALWLRAKASLGLGDVAVAQQDFEEVLQTGGDFEAQAREILNQLPD